jgi:DNA-binding CsgD family transcriptional regulator
MTAPATDLVEREADLHTLQQRLAAVRATRSGATVLVLGEAGIGKTSLLRVFAAALPDDCALWWGQCDALQTAHPLAPLHDVARTADVRFRRVLADPQVARATLFEAVLDELRHAAGVTVFVVEDAHWADDATLDLVRFIGRRIEKAPALLLMSWRDDEVPASHPLRRAIGELPAPQRLTLRRLSAAGVRTLAERAGRDPGAAPALHAATQGNPFFVSELLRQEADADVPATVQALVLARYASLAKPAQAVLRLASVVPARIERWLVDVLLAPSIDDLEACLGCGLLVADGPWLQYRHELARVAVESSLSVPAAQALHAQVLAALDAGAARHGEPTPARRVHHASLAGDAAALRHWAPVAAEQARQRGAHREAARHWRSALREAGAESTEQRITWLEGCAVECQLTDQLDEAIVHRHELDILHHGAGDTLRAADNLSRLALVLVLALRNAEADAANRRAITLLEALPPSRELAHAYWVDAQLRMLNRECARSAERAAQAHALAEQLDFRNVQVTATGTLGAALLFIDWPAGVAHLQRALQMARADANDWVVANTLINLGSAAAELYRLAEAEPWLREAFAFCSAHEIDFYRHYAQAWLARVELAAGRWDAAAVDAFEASTRSGPTTTSRVMALVALGCLRVRRGDPAADEALAQALGLALATGTLQRIGPVRAARAEAAWMRGDVAACRREAEAAFALAQARGHAWIGGELALWLHRCGALAQTPAACAEPYAHLIEGRWREAAEAWQRLGCPYERAQALAEGDAAAQLEALAVFDELGARPAAEALRRRLHEAGVRGVTRGARPSTRANPRGLTARELEVLRLLCDGLRNAEIAGRLHRSVRTVDHHVAAVYAKLGVESRHEALLLAQREGLLQSGQVAAPN